MKRIVLKIIRFYQKSRWFYSPLLKAMWLSDEACRFYPSCSNYCYQAVEKYGTLKGVFICIKRVSRCHPWSKGGIDKLR